MGRYLAEIKKFESGGEPYLQNLQKSDFGSFVGFVGTPPPHFEISQGTFVGFVGPPSPRFEKLQDHQAGPHVSVAQLPARLVTAARRVCREIHNDDDEAVQEMLADLCWNDPKDWQNLIEHLEAQSPPVQAEPICKTA